MKSLRAWSPWGPAESVRWVAIAVVGNLTCVVAWWLAHREAAFDHQVRWVAVAIAGFIVAAYGDVSWLLRARWTVIQRRSILLPDDVAVAEGAVAVAGAVLAGPGLDRFHRPACPLAKGRPWPSVDRSAAVAAGQRPCGICNP
jgi:hypothetical protein